MYTSEVGLAAQGRLAARFSAHPQAKRRGTVNRVRSERVPERVPGSGRSERERNSRYGVAQAMVVKVRMRLRKPIFVCVILKGSSSLPMCGKDQVA